VVGSPGTAGRAPADLTGPADQARSVGAAYDAAAAGWDRGPGLMYSALAHALVEHAGVSVSGAVVADLGAGTGTAGSAAAAAGARRVVSIDIAPRMLALCPRRLRPVAADIAALPFRNDCFDLAVAAFCLGHLASLPGCLREVRRVSAALAASAFAPGWSHPAKGAVDAVLAGYGFRSPGWYQAFKRDTEPQAADPAVFRTAAETAGFARIDVATIEVPTGLATSAQLADWRLGMAHIAPFVDTLTATRRNALRAAAEEAVKAAGGGRVEARMLVLTAQS
jgi:ubiquinone/menaquinone biosynthesis C-methylase UbiE